MVFNFHDFQLPPDDDDVLYDVHAWATIEAVHRLVEEEQDFSFDATALRDRRFRFRTVEKRWKTMMTPPPLKIMMMEMMKMCLVLDRRALR